MATPTTPYWQLQLGSESGLVTGLEELAQALKVLLLTPLGSCPLRPDFGCDLLASMDAPGPRAVAGIIRTVYRAVAQWEPRITLKSIRVAEMSADGRVTLLVTWSPSATSVDVIAETRTTEVAA